MTKGGPKGLNSDLDRHHFGTDRGVAKSGFAKAKDGKAPEGQTKSAEVGDSIKKTRPELNFDMPGGGPVRAQLAAGRVNAEKGQNKFEAATARAAEKKLTKQNDLRQNFNEKSSDKGRE